MNSAVIFYFARHRAECAECCSREILSCILCTYLYGYIDQRTLRTDRMVPCCTFFLSRHYSRDVAILTRILLKINYNQMLNKSSDLLRSIILSSGNVVPLSKYTQPITIQLGHWHSDAGYSCKAHNIRHGHLVT